MSAPTTFRFRSIAGPPLSQANTVSVKDSALVVIDVQNFYLPDNMWPVAGIEKTNERISALVERYRKAGSEVIWVAHTGDKTATVESTKGSPFGCIPGFEPQGDEHYIAKTHGSSFHETDLDEYLRAKGVKNIVLVGYQPQFCIVTTAVSGQHQGFGVTVVRDCIGSHDLRSWDDKRDIPGDELADTACDLIQDALGLVVLAKDIQE